MNALSIWKSILGVIITNKTFTGFHQIRPQNPFHPNFLFMITTHIEKLNKSWLRSDIYKAFPPFVSNPFDTTISVQRIMGGLRESLTLVIPRRLKFLNVVFIMLCLSLSSCHICAILNGISGVTIMAAPPLISSAWFPPSERTTATAINQVQWRFAILKKS